MRRRDLLGLLVLGGLVVLGRGLRRWLLVDPRGNWRDPGWLAEHLPGPDPASVPTPTTPTTPSGPPAEPIDPNTCSPDSLTLLPGVGPAIAGRIADARARGVHFACARDLQEIRGIGPRTVERLEPYLTFGKRDMGEMDSTRSAR